jgi:hypothetical protein
MSQTTYSRALALTLLLTAATAEAQPTPIAPPDDTTQDAVATPIAGPPVDPADVEVSAVEAEEVEAEEAPVDDTGRVTASLGRGVRIESTDGRFMLNIRARAQLLATAQSDVTPRDDTDAAGEGSITFQARRARLLFQGHLFGPEWTYYLQLGFSNLDTESDLRSPLRDAYMNWSGCAT